MAKKTRFVFDWAKCAEIIASSTDAEHVAAGLSEDLNCTCGTIWTKDDGPILHHSAHLNSIWATPILIVDGEEMDCWLQEFCEEHEQFKEFDNCWPDYALRILMKPKPKEPTSSTFLKDVKAETPSFDIANFNRLLNQ